MNFSKLLLKTLIFVSILFLIPKAGSAQEEPRYNIELIKAKWFGTEDSNRIIAVFYVTPKKRKDYRPVLSMKVGYSINNDSPTVVDIQKQKPVKVRLVVFGENVKEKSEQLYNMVKDKIELKNDGEDNMFLVALFFDNVARKKPEKMSITYGLWEKRDLNRRVEKKYDFAVE